MKVQRTVCHSLETAIDESFGHIRVAFSPLLYSHPRSVSTTPTPQPATEQTSPESSLGTDTMDSMPTASSPEADADPWAIPKGVSLSQLDDIIRKNVTMYTITKDNKYLQAVSNAANARLEISRSNAHNLIERFLTSGKPLGDTELGDVTKACMVSCIPPVLLVHVVFSPFSFADLCGNAVANRLSGLPKPTSSPTTVSRRLTATCTLLWQANRPCGRACFLTFYMTVAFWQKLIEDAVCLLSGTATSGSRTVGLCVKVKEFEGQRKVSDAEALMGEE